MLFRSVSQSRYGLLVESWWIVLLHVCWDLLGLPQLAEWFWAAKDDVGFGALLKARLAEVSNDVLLLRMVQDIVLEVECAVVCERDRVRVVAVLMNVDLEYIVMCCLFDEVEKDRVFVDGFARHP